MARWTSIHIQRHYAVPQAMPSVAMNHRYILPLRIPSFLLAVTIPQAQHGNQNPTKASESAEYCDTTSIKWGIISTENLPCRYTGKVGRHDDETRSCVTRSAQILGHFGSARIGLGRRTHAEEMLLSWTLVYVLAIQPTFNALVSLLALLFSGLC